MIWFLKEFIADEKIPFKERIRIYKISLRSSRKHRRWIKYVFKELYFLDLEKEKQEVGDLGST